jgi:hypothetical protein
MFARYVCSFLPMYTASYLRWRAILHFFHHEKLLASSYRQYLLTLNRMNLLKQWKVQGECSTDETPGCCMTYEVNHLYVGLERTVHTYSLAHSFRPQPFTNAPVVLLTRLQRQDHCLPHEWLQRHGLPQTTWSFLYTVSFRNSIRFCTYAWSLSSAITTAYAASICW